MSDESVSTQSTDFDRKVRTYFVECARRVELLAPLPEFKDAISVLVEYDKWPNAGNLNWVEEVYWTLKDGEFARRDYGKHTAVSEFYFGVLHILELVIAGTDSVSISDTIHFAEAAYCARRVIDPRGFNSPADAALRRELDFQNALYKKLFD